MVTILGLPNGVPVLVGALSMHRRGHTKGRPVLAMQSWCPWCRDHHSLDWPDPPFGMDCVLPVTFPCRSGPFAGSEVMVGPDPARDLENRRVVLHFGQALRRWRAERGHRLISSEAGEIDRRSSSGGSDTTKG